MSWAGLWGGYGDSAHSSIPGTGSFLGQADQPQSGDDPHRHWSMSLHRNHPPGLTWVGRMPCLIPVLCVPVPITPAAATSETAPRLWAKGLGEHLSLLGTADIPKQHKERILPHPF